MQRLGRQHHPVVVHGGKRIIPDKFMYPSALIGTDARRERFKQTFQNNEYSYDTNNKPTCDINDGDFQDFDFGSLNFDVTITATEDPGAALPPYVRLVQGVWNLFREERIISPNEVCRQLQSGLKRSLDYAMFAEAGIDATLGAMWGVGTVAQRNNWAATTTRYACPLDLGFFDCGMIPMGEINQRLQYEILLAAPSTCVETNMLNVSIKLSNMRLIGDCVKPNMDYVMGMRNKIRTTGLKLHWHESDFHTAPITSNSPHLPIPHRSSSLIGYRSVFMDLDTLNDPLIDDRHITYNKLGALSAQVYLNNTLRPQEPIRYDGRAIEGYCEQLRWVGKMRSKGLMANPPPISLQRFNEDRFIMCMDLQVHPGELMLNPQSTAGHQANMEHRVTLAVAPGQNWSLVTFVEFTVTMKIDTEGRVSRIL